MITLKLYFGLIFLGLTALVSSFVNGDTEAHLSEPLSVEQEYVSVVESEIIAREFLISSPTFVYDGIAATLELIEIVPDSNSQCWNLVYGFSCKHAGYGDRGGQAITQVITLHKATISVKKGKVTLAIIDGWWDIQRQEAL